MTTTPVHSITDEQIAEIEDDDCYATAAEFNAIIARLRKAEKDAARYRWLRDNCDRQWDVMYQDIEIIIRDTAAEDCEPLDEIIDAAMAGGVE